ncbi:MAG: ATP-binding protein, partial [Burkholderiales bacterium]
VWNILRNAIKFTPAGGAITLSTATAGGQFVWSCTDSGIGIEPAALSRIFTAFEQADQEVSERFGGLGLGLAIARGLVLEHEGVLDVRSEGRGRGATFTLMLDAIPPASPGRPRTRPWPTPPCPAESGTATCCWSRTTPTRPTCSAWACAPMATPSPSRPVARRHCTSPACRPSTRW